MQRQARLSLAAASGIQLGRRARAGWRFGRRHDAGSRRCERRRRGRARARCQPGRERRGRRSRRWRRPRCRGGRQEQSRDAATRDDAAQPRRAKLAAPNAASATSCMMRMRRARRKPARGSRRRAAGRAAAGDGALTDRRSRDESVLALPFGGVERLVGEPQDPVDVESLRLALVSPMLTVMSSQPSATLARVAATLARKRSTRCSASAGVVCGNNSANSSPPMRASVSISRTCFAQCS